MERPKAQTSGKDFFIVNKGEQNVNKPSLGRSYVERRDGARFRGVERRSLCSVARAWTRFFPQR